MPAQDDTPQLRDIPAAIGLLTRLPVRVDTDHATSRGARAAWAYPLVGILVALIALGVAQAALWAGLSSSITAGLTLAVMVIVTGAMHEDGLADSADGLWGGWDPTRRLEIMKDSHIGAYGVIVLILSLGLRWQALALLITADLLIPALITTAALSRAAMVPLMATLPHARDAGLSHKVGRAGGVTVTIACAIAALIALFALNITAIWAVVAALLAMLCCGAISIIKIKGQTGDILGATQQIAEIATLLTLATLLT